MINYTKKICTKRERNEISFLEGSIESDRGRILSAPALRRLQNRTQVFALELNASIRTRLTHSLEVAQSARYIAKTILQKLKENGLEKYHLQELENGFVSTVEMASLLHDIGNPPFGHFAEQSINSWMSKKGVKILDKLYGESSELKEKLVNDICNYDGNAQAIRIVTKLQRLNLSYTQIASILKYTRGAYENKPSKDEELYYIKKKPGFYYSEKDSVKKICEALDMKLGHRFPLTYIMEAADDISYLTADIEDAVDKGILRFEDIYRLIKKECEKQGETYLLELVDKYYNRVKQSEEEPYQFNMFLTLTRATLIGSLVRHVADVYVQNHEAIFEGSFSSALLEYDQSSKYSKAVKILQDISYKHIYMNKAVQNIELKGYAVINGLFEIYSPLLELSAEDFSKLVKEESIDCFISQRLIKRLSSKQIVAYMNDMEKIEKEGDEYILLEWYYRARLIIDYISGMTDDFALDEYKKLSAIN